MDNNNKSNKSMMSSVGFLDLLLIVFVVLKLCKVIAWSWLWVLAPAWIPMALYIVLAVIVSVFSD